MNGKKGGVAIIISPQLYLQWKLSGKAKKKLRGGLTVGHITRILSLSIHFELSTTKKKVIVAANFITCSSPQSRFSISRDEELPLKNEEHEFDSIYDLIGPFGNPRISKTGQAILEHVQRAYFNIFKKRITKVGELGNALQ